MENYQQIHNKAKRLEALINLSNNIREKERREPIPFNDFLFLAAKNPEYVFRDIYQLFHDMIHHYIPEGTDEYEQTSDSIGFMNYDTEKLFVSDLDNPFFADRLFANRIVNLANAFRKGSQKHYIYIFEGPPGSGKSTFLNNLLSKFEDYSKTDEGTIFKTYWKLDIEKLGGFNKVQQFVHDNLPDIKGKDEFLNSGPVNYPEKYVEFSSPNHDHPIIQIPKTFREQFLNELISDKSFKERLFSEKQYEWVLREQPSSMNSSIYKALLDRLGDPLEVFNMLYAKKNYFNRQLGVGISVFNPGDELHKRTLTNRTLQYLLDDLFGNDEIRIAYSYLANTNNGILALMDIKEHNIDRLKNFHGIISDGVHKVELTEEQIKTFFIGLVNPEDKVHYEQIQSFKDRIISVKIPYVLDYNTEVNIYKNKFGEKIKKDFLPGVLENFAKIIVATRLHKVSPPLKEWIKNPLHYKKYLDTNMLLLKMDVYTGVIPSWLTEEDIKRFDKKTRKAILNASESEGFKGISGRQSINVFNHFYSKYQNDERQVRMDDVVEYFISQIDLELYKEVPKDFLDKIEDLYDYNVLQQVKEAIYYYNEKQISNDIINYTFAINFEPGDVKTSPFTKEKIKITEDYFANFESMILGSDNTDEKRKQLRKDIQSRYVTETLREEIRIEGKEITKTKLFKELFSKYTKNIKENALVPYAENENFRRAIKDYNTKSFEKYDQRLKRDVNLLITNMQKKFKYSEEGGRQVSIYVLDKELHKKY